MPDDIKEWQSEQEKIGDAMRVLDRALSGTYVLSDPEERELISFYISKLRERIDSQALEIENLNKELKNRHFAMEEHDKLIDQAIENERIASDARADTVKLSKPGTDEELRRVKDLLAFYLGFSEE